MATSILTPPISAPVSLLEVKRHLRIESDDDDDYLNDLIASSTSHLESVSGLKLITQTWRQYLDCLPNSSSIRLEVSPVRSITELRVFGENGLANPVPLQAMELDSVSTPPRLLVKSQLASGQHFNGIEIDMVAGFGDTSLDVPDGLRRALLLLIAHAFEFRGAVPINQQPASEPHGFQTLIAPYKRVLF